MTARQKSASMFVRIFAIPAIIAGLSLIGLFAALLGDGALDGTSWLALSIPIAAILWAMLRRRR